MTEFNEAIKGFTDLPIAVISLIFAILLKRKSKSTSTFFLLLFFTALTGGVAHIFSFGITVTNIIWVFLYPLLSECTRRFSNMLSRYASGKKVISETWVFIFEGIFYITALVLMFFVGKYDILAFAAFALICLFKTAVYIFKSAKVPKKIIFTLVLLIPALLFQFLSSYIPYAVVYEHFILTVTLFVVYKIASEVD